MDNGEVATKIIQYESGNMDVLETIEFFSFLVKSGLAWQLQGSYGRAATALINNGYLDKQGKILKTEK